MDPGTIVGLVVAFGAIFVAMIMEGGNPASIMLIPPLLLVFGGTFGAAMAGGTLKEGLSIGNRLKLAILGRPVPASDEVVKTLVTLAERARREGLLALEDAARDVTDPFLRRGLEFAIDGTDPDALRDILDAEIEGVRSRGRADAKFFADMGGYAPTIGIIGTVLGLVHVLENLSNPDELGHLIAAAFVATLWGVLTANVMWLPMGNKIKRVIELECAHMELVVEGILAIQSGVNPRLVDQKLRALAPPAGKAGKAEKAGKAGKKAA